MTEIDDMLQTFQEEVKDEEAETSESEVTEMDGEDISLPRKQQERIELCRNCGEVVEKIHTRCGNCGTQTRYTGPGYKS